MRKKKKIPLSKEMLDEKEERILKNKKPKRKLGPHVSSFLIYVPLSSNEIEDVKRLIREDKILGIFPSKGNIFMVGFGLLKWLETGKLDTKIRPIGKLHYTNEDIERILLLLFKKAVERGLVRCDSESISSRIEEINNDRIDIPQVESERVVRLNEEEIAKLVGEGDILMKKEELKKEKKDITHLKKILKKKGKKIKKFAWSDAPIISVEEVYEDEEEDMRRT